MITVRISCTWSSRLTSFFAICRFQLFIRPAKERWKPLRARHSVCFWKTPASHWRTKTHSAPIFDRIHVFNMAYLHFYFTFTAFVMCYFFYEPITTFMIICWRLSLDCQITCPALVSSRGSYIYIYSTCWFVKYFLPKLNHENLRFRAR